MQSCVIQHSQSRSSASAVDSEVHFGTLKTDHLWRAEVFIIMCSRLTFRSFHFVKLLYSDTQPNFFEFLFFLPFLLSANVPNASRTSIRIYIYIQCFRLFNFSQFQQNLLYLFFVFISSYSLVQVLSRIFFFHKMALQPWHDVRVHTINCGNEVLLYRLDQKEISLLKHFLHFSLSLIFSKRKLFEKRREHLIYADAGCPDTPAE